MGKTREEFIRDGIAKYVRYLKPYTDIEIRELKEEKIGDLRDAPLIRKKESEKIFKTAPTGALLVALDERGREFTSHEFAAFINGTLESGVRDMAFIIGGAMGLDESVTERSNKVLAMKWRGSCCWSSSTGRLPSSRGKRIITERRQYPKSK
jgi:23S rRNA (pseudouridine1915-N3)-methyltransferase